METFGNLTTSLFAASSAATTAFSWGVLGRFLFVLIFGHQKLGLLALLGALGLLRLSLSTKSGELQSLGD